MKKLGKLSISPEKIMKNEELINLKGGYAGLCCTRTKNGESHIFCHHSEPVMDSWVHAWTGFGWTISCYGYYVV